MRKITEIIVHCTATRPDKNLGAAEIDCCHRRRGFNSIGYHYVVRLDGSIEKGRDEAVAGAHCTGHNSCSIGVAYVGGLDDRGHAADTRTADQRRSLLSLLSELRRRYPEAKIHSHRDFAAKACPCFDATQEYATL